MFSSRYGSNLDVDSIGNSSGMPKIKGLAPVNTSLGVHDDKIALN